MSASATGLSYKSKCADQRSAGACNQHQGSNILNSTQTPNCTVTSRLQDRQGRAALIGKLFERQAKKRSHQQQTPLLEATRESKSFGTDHLNENSRNHMQSQKNSLCQQISRQNPHSNTTQNFFQVNQATDLLPSPKPQTAAQTSRIQRQNEAQFCSESVRAQSERAKSRIKSSIPCSKLMPPVSVASLGQAAAAPSTAAESIFIARSSERAPSLRSQGGLSQATKSKRDMIKEKVTERMLSTFGRDQNTTQVIRSVVESQIGNKQQLKISDFDQMESSIHDALFKSNQQVQSMPTSPNKETIFFKSPASICESNSPIKAAANGSTSSRRNHNWTQFKTNRSHRRMRSSYMGSQASIDDHDSNQGVTISPATNQFAGYQLVGLQKVQQKALDQLSSKSKALSSNLSSPRKCQDYCSQASLSQASQKQPSLFTNTQRQPFIREVSMQTRSQVLQDMKNQLRKSLNIEESSVYETQPISARTYGQSSLNSKKFENKKSLWDMIQKHKASEADQKDQLIVETKRQNLAQTARLQRSQRDKAQAEGQKVKMAKAEERQQADKKFQEFLVERKKQEEQAEAKKLQSMASFQEQLKKNEDARIQKATQEFKLDRTVMRTPPMVRDMQQRQENYDDTTKKQLASTSANNFDRLNQEKVSLFDLNQRQVNEIKREGHPNPFILRLQDKSRKEQEDHLNTIREKATARFKKASLNENGEQLFNEETLSEGSRRNAEAALSIQKEQNAQYAEEQRKQKQAHQEKTLKTSIQNFSRMLEMKEQQARKPEMPSAEFYATIKGPNYDNIWITHDGFGQDLDRQIEQDNKLAQDGQFMGMSDQELLCNRHTFQQMGLLN